MKPSADAKFFPLLVAGVFAVATAGGLVTGCTTDSDDRPVQNGGENSDTDAGIDDASNDENDGGGFDASGDADRPSPDSGEDWDWEDEDFGIQAVIPARGPVSGGTEVHVHGTELSADTQLWFGNQPVEVDVTQGQLVAETPPAETSGPVTVRAVSTNGEESELLNGFTYSNPVRIDDVSPDRLPNTGGVEIDLTGSGFVEPMGVSFSGTPARRIDVVNDGLARVVVPRMPRGHADLRVSIPDENRVVEDAVYFFEPAEIEVVDPAVGSIAGGEQVTIRGRGFDSNTAVEFGGQPADVQSVDIAAGELSVTTPAADSTGPVDVRVETTHDVDMLQDGFWYDDGAENTIYSIQPARAYLEGGTEHVVSGRNLDAADAEILVGTEPADILESDAQSARIEAPAADSTGAVDVVFERGGVEQDRLDDALTYVRELSVDGVDPDTGSSDGGEEVTITGQGFDAVEHVSFGGVSASFDVVDDTEISATAPEAEPGTVDVVVSTANQECVAEDAFHYHGDVEVWSMQPSRGSIAGNTYVTLHGQGFFGTIDVDVGDQAAGDIRRIDPYTVAFRTPPGASTGAVPVELDAMDQQVESPYPFVYFNPTSSFGGAHGPSIDGALNVSVLNYGGAPVPGAFVMLSTDPDTSYKGFTDQNGRITLSGPDLLGPQTITATAPELSTFTVRELNARNVTIILNPLEPQQGDPGDIPPPPMAHFEGEITVKGKGTDPMGGGLEINMSQVRTTRNAMLRPTLPPGEDATVDGEGEYELVSRVGDLALVGLCGYYDDETEEFTPKLMAVERNFAVSDGQRIEADLECDIPLDESLPIRINDPVWAPDGPSYNEVTTYLDFGYEGVFRMPGTDRGLADIIYAEPLPAPEDQLEGMTFSVFAGSYTNGSLPYTQTTIREIEEVDQLQSTAPLVGVPDLLDPPEGGVVGPDLWLGQKGSNNPDFYFLVVRNGMGLPVWSFLVPGDDEIIPMPEFPAFAGLSEDERPRPYQPGEFYTIGYGIDIDGFDYNAFTWGDFQSSRWSAFAVDSWSLRLVE